MMSTVQERMAERAIWWAEKGNLGYDMGPDREHFWVGGETDCSKFMIEIVREQGLSTGSATYTGDMRVNFCAHGWVWIPWSRIGGVANLMVGDILLNETHHTAMYVGNGRIAQASSNEYGTAYGGKPGDQGRPNGTGETNVCAFYIYSHGWDGVLRYVGDNPQPTPTPTPSGSIDVDGYWGSDTNSKLQAALGTPVDGVISSQPTSNYSILSASCRVGWDWVSPSVAEGSACIVALQRKVGSDPDGFCGPNTVSALQRYLGTPVDGRLDGPSTCVMEMQRRLNDGTF